MTARRGNRSVTNRATSVDLAPEKKLIDGALTECFSTIPSQSVAIREAATYTIASGGYRWRPLLLLTVGRSYGASDTELLPMACLVEFLHTAAMILDDLPCMDNARMRHGRKACHLVFGEDRTILASHFLVTACFEILRDRYSSRYIGQLTKLIADMISGQAADLGLNGRLADCQELEQVYRMKSGRLFGFSAKIGATLAAAPAGEIQCLEQFGETLGLAYQVLDDIYDLYGGPPEVGKPTRQDQNKCTFATLFDLEVATAITYRFRVQALSTLGHISVDSTHIRALCKSIVPLPQNEPERNGSHINRMT